jgi:hypothetical protein
MSIIPQEHASGYCDGCQHKSDDLTPLNHRDLCPRCYREAIADMPLNMPREVINTRDVWED